MMLISCSAPCRDELSILNSKDEENLQHANSSSTFAWPLRGLGNLWGKHGSSISPQIPSTEPSRSGQWPSVIHGQSLRTPFDI